MILDIAYAIRLKRERKYNFGNLLQRNLVYSAKMAVLEAEIGLCFMDQEEISSFVRSGGSNLKPSEW